MDAAPIHKHLFLWAYSNFVASLPPGHSAVFPSFTPVDKRREERGNPDTHWVCYIINSFSIFINNK